MTSLAQEITIGSDSLGGGFHILHIISVLPGWTHLDYIWIRFHLCTLLIPFPNKSCREGDPDGSRGEGWGRLTIARQLSQVPDHL